MILVNADAYLALNVEKDAHHKQAINLLGQLRDVAEDLVTTWDVVDEVATKLAYFTTKKKANEFLGLILDSDTRIEFMDRGRARLTEKLFAKQSSKKVSLTDCANMVMASELGIRKIFSFDRHYVRNGFELLRVD